MDITKDKRLEELKVALSAMPLVKNTDISATEKNNSYDWKEIDLNSIPALTTIDLSQFTNSSLAPFPNTAVTQGTVSSATPNVYTIGGGGGGSGGVHLGSGIQYQYPNVTTTTGTTWTTGLGSGTSAVQINADDVVVKGKSLMQSLVRIEEQLGILDCDEILEEEWEALRSLGLEYRKMKQRIEDKMKTFNTLKK